MSRRIAPLLVMLLVAGCAARRAAPKLPLLPLTPAWKTLLGDFVTSPLAADGRRVYVATRDGAVLPPETGRTQSARPARWSRAHGCAGIRAAHPCRPRNQGPVERAVLRGKHRAGQPRIVLGAATRSGYGC